MGKSTFSSCGAIRRPPRVCQNMVGQLPHVLADMDQLPPPPLHWKHCRTRASVVSVPHPVLDGFGIHVETGGFGSAGVVKAADANGILWK
ncbi:MAG: hypothetical protein OXC17_12335 [Aestuariivita sp.]|nr:hypothetical protein [Aestuariivita sp.]